MIYVGDTPPELTNRVPWAGGATIEQRREGTRKRKAAWQKAVRETDRKLDGLFAEVQRYDARHPRPTPHREAGGNVAESLRDALLGAGLAQALRGAVARAAKPAPFALDPIDFDEAMAIAAINHQERNAR